jgi:phage tail sheath protein FI
MPVVPRGSINTTALVVPDLYVQITPPQNLILNGVPTDVVGMVGTASWGPANQPVIAGTMSDYARAFGPIMPRKHDLGTQVATAVQQGAQNFRCVRVTDGTDTAAQASVPGTTALFTAIHTGSLGNTISVALDPSSRPGAWRLTVSMPGRPPEAFDSLTGTGAAFWQALAVAVNAGQGPHRGPSQMIVASDGGAIAEPASFSITLGTTASGTDGADGVLGSHLVGTDVAPRRGMYALRGQRCGIIVLADCDDAVTWTTQAGFGIQEGAYVILTTPAGDQIANATTTKHQAGLDSYAAKLMFGDWLWWSDQTNDVVRLVSPQGFVAGRLANLSPEQSSLNKPLYGIVGSQKSGTPGSGEVASYSSAELAALLEAGIDVVSNPQPGGSFWGVRGGHNSASDPAVNGDNYTRLTNFVAATLASGMGRYVGALINVDLFRNVRATLLSFLQGMFGQGLLGSVDGSLPFSVVCDRSNNPASRTGLGYVQADVQIQYQSINEKFIVNVEGGQTVQVARQTLPSGQAG